MQSNSHLNKLVIIPACNNTSELLRVLNDFKGSSCIDELCLVIDAAREEDLFAIVGALQQTEVPFKIISRQRREGVGSAIRQGIAYGLQKDYDVAVVMAGNGKDQPGEIPRLLAPIVSEDFDYVQGSRFLPGGKAIRTPLLRGLFSRFFPFIWTLVISRRCTDVTNGFRAYKLDVFSDKRINLDQSWLDDYQLEYYLHYKILTLGYKMREVPVSKVYKFRHKGGYSNISPLRDWWKIVGPLVYLKLRIKV